MVSEETSPGPEAWPMEKEASVGQGCGAAGSSEVRQSSGGREGPRLAGDCMRRQRGLGEDYRGRGHSSVSAALRPPPTPAAPPGCVMDKGSLTWPLEDSFPGYPGLEGRLPFQGTPITLVSHVSQLGLVPCFLVSSAFFFRVDFL